jgi:ABC-2 type transport system ATP-binding protein
MSDTPALSIQDLRKTYPKGTEALKGVSLTVEKGAFFALLGPNGAGKTSLISIIAGLATKSSGAVFVDGYSQEIEPEKVKASIGLVPQEFNFSIFEKVIDIVLDQAGYYGISRVEAMPYATEILTKLGLWEKHDKKAETLSGGMKRRLMIARALIHKPTLLLLDEPTAGVDVELRRSMWEFLRELNQSGTTIILTTHYLEEAEELCKEVAIINQGSIIQEGSVKELLQKLNVVTLQLDTVEPLTEATMALLKEFNVTKTDEQTLTVVLAPGETINEVMRKLTSIGVQVQNLRNPGSRLEEVFMNLIQQDTV